VAMGREEACRRLASASPRIIPGFGPKTVERLAALGYTTIGAIQQADPEELARRFGGRHGRDLHARVHFHGSDVVEAESGPAKSRSNETTFDRDIADQGELEAVLARQAAQLAEEMRRKGIRGRTVAIKVRLDDWTTVTRARTLPEAVSDTEVITRVAIELLRAYAPPRPVRLLGVRMAAFTDDADAAAAPAGNPQLALPL
jgi:DNA polymerase IV